MTSQSVPSYSRGAQDKALLALTIGQAFDRTATCYPEREALIVRHQDQRLSWAQLSRAVDLHARGFMALGLQAGDRLGIWAPNCLEWFICQFASAQIGVILVNINPAYRLSELDYVLKQSACQWLVCALAWPPMQCEPAGFAGGNQPRRSPGARLFALGATGHAGGRCQA